MSTSTIIYAVVVIGGVFLMMRMHRGHGGHGGHGGGGSHHEDAARPAPEPKPAPGHEHGKGEPARAHSGH